MRVNFNTFNYISNIKTFKRENVSVPVFKSQPTNDIFVRTTEPIVKLSEVEERRASIPQYLYHLTNMNSYEKIMEEGQIKLSKDIIDGVFMFDMEDFQKNWRNTKNPSKRGTLAKSLVEQALKQEQGLVLLRIPTENLDPMKFAIRPEDEVTSYLKSMEFSFLTSMYENKGGILNNKDKLPKDLVNGFSPVKSKEYFEAGRPIEYIYQDNIDLSKISLEKILEIPDMDRKFVWAYSIKDYNNLFDSFKENAYNS